MAFEIHTQNTFLDTDIFYNYLIQNGLYFEKDYLFAICYIVNREIDMIVEDKENLEIFIEYLFNELCEEERTYYKDFVLWQT